MSLIGKDLALKAADAALQKKAQDLVVLELIGLTVIADYFVICSGESTTQVKAIADFIEHDLLKQGIRPMGKEGLNYGHWALLDYGDVVIHVFERESREYYSLEKLWMDAKTIEVHEDTSDLGGKDKRAVYS
ncbi:MAG: ribosome silencing factor [Nitrospirae bacterium]|nr:ribosome silencing factor [Nitrospirota bacterium]